MPQYSLKSLLLVTTLIGVEAGLLILVVRQRSLAPIEPNLSLFIFVAFGAVVGAVVFARYHRPAFGAALGAIAQIAILCIKVFVFPNH
jgi:hypothetical protein